MIAEAYAYADGGGGLPKELRLAQYIDRFGAQAVLGRLMGAGEIRRIDMAERIIRIYQSRKQAANWKEWVGSHPKEAELLAYAEGLTHGE